MQPENSLNTNPGVEQLPLPPTMGPEAVPSLPPIDASLERGQQRVEQAAEAGATVMDATVQATAAATIAVPTAGTLVDPQTTTTKAAPLVAADEDVIEKEWVDKAKDIIDQTKDDPHTRTAKVNELQRDYLSKRYGKVVGASE